MKEEPTKPPDVNILVEEDYTSWRGETELRTNDTLECRKRKQITEQLMDHQTEYNKKMKLKQKKQRSFKVDDFAQIRFLVKLMIDLHDNGNCAKVVVQIRKISTYAS